jgi:mannose-6-phosphate isomerase-like protein (cupin superfamily)
MNGSVARPWRYYEELLVRDGYRVKRLVISPGQRTSLQYHVHRREYWVVTEGDGDVMYGSMEGGVCLGKGSTWVVEKEMKHRLRAGPNGMTVVEIQLGEICEETDVVRLEDDYGRV